MDLWAGTSGFGYREWIGTFYPPRTAASAMLGFYAGRLPAVEIDNTFYRLPRTSVLEGWANQVPEDFRFAIKASRRITHMKRLRAAEDETAYLLQTVGALGQNLGPVLFQLPSNFPKDRDRLEAFLDLLRGETRVAFEFRHPSWFDQDILELLRRRGVALCVVDSEDGPPAPLLSTAPFGYVRLRRPEYGPAELESWFGRISSQGWSQAYIFFKHEDGGVGPEYAARFLALAQVTRTAGRE